MLNQRSITIRLIALIGIILIAAAGILGMPAGATADSLDPENDPVNTLIHGAQVFQVHCEGCHINGGNIIRRGKTLKLKALQKNEMDSLDAIAQIVTNGKNNMSAFRDRLTEQQIQEVAAYVLSQAQTDWKKP
ncbi:c-type cytochrome [Leptolyngbya ohadii]|uniref:c-type cytochrome n=1 Tax=Leptolyngbya ohadii TaxID=1962290 RepID=UPI0021F18967|nr:c-type cytochrome [Leptolyngbya ohadii]